MSITKTCKDCGETKPLSEFPSCQHHGKTEYLARCHPCHRVYHAERLQRWRDGVRLSQDIEADLSACVAVLCHYQHKLTEDTGRMLGNAAQLIECVIYLESQPSKPKKPRPSEAMEGGSHCTIWRKRSHEETTPTEQSTSTG